MTVTTKMQELLSALFCLEHYFEKNPQRFDARLGEFKRPIKKATQKLAEDIFYVQVRLRGETNHMVVDRFLENQD